MPSATATGQLTSFYGEMTSLERVFASLRRNDIDVERLQARDLFIGFSPPGSKARIDAS